MPTIDLTDDGLVAVAAAVRRTLDEDWFPHAPRLETLRRALGKLDPASIRGPCRLGRCCRRPGEPVGRDRGDD